MLYAQTRLDTPMGPGFFIFFNELFDEGERGGTTKQFEVLPRRVYLKKKPGEPMLRWEDILGEEKTLTDIRITDKGKTYKAVDIGAPTVEQAIQLMPTPRLEEKLLEVELKYEVTKKEARQILEQLVEVELIEAEELREELVINDDLALILIMNEA